MSFAEPPITAVNAAVATTDAASFLTNCGVESIFTKVLIVLLLFFFLIRVCYVIVHRLRRNRNRDHDRYLLNPTVAPDNLRQEGNAQNNNVNDAVVTVGAVDFNVAISSYPSFMYSANVGASAGAGSNDTACPICISEYVESEMMRMMPQCGHYFHLNCIDEWLKINWSCPVCRDSPLQQAEPPSCS